MTERPAISAEARRKAGATWLVRLEQETASEADWLAFEAWLADPANKRAVDEIEAAMIDVEAHRGALTHLMSPADNVVQLSARKPPRRIVFVGLAAAATAATALIAVQFAAPQVREFAYAAPRDSAQVVTLPDDSTVTLNCGASVRVRWSTNERRIELERGEAAFEVVHNAASPFVVTAGAETIRDLGTEFNVLRENNALTVTVRAGSVEVQALGQAATLSPGQQVRVSGGQLALREINAGDTLAWREGRLIYRDTPLAQVVNDLNRYGSIPISVGDDAAAALSFSGVLVIDTPRAMTQRLEAFLPVRSEHNEQGIVLRSC